MSIQQTNADHRVGATSIANAEMPDRDITRLNAWKSRGDRYEQRDSAVQKILLCLERGETSLDLSDLGLLTHPPVLPPQLETLDISGNALTQFTVKLPPNLQTLNLSNNRLTRFTSPLPPNLNKLDLSKNALPELKVELPGALAELHLGQNKLTEAPAGLPAELKILDLRANFLQHFPTVLPIFLQGLDVRDNNIVQLPVLPTYTLINIDESKLDSESLPILAQYREDFRAYLEDPDFEFEHGGNVIGVTEAETTASYDALFTSIAHPLAETIAAHYPREHRAELMAAWQPIETESGAAMFSKFLTRLDKTVNTSIKGFDESLHALLSRMLESPSLRETNFSIAVNASDSCEDRTSLAFLEMQKAGVVDDVGAGKYNKNLPELISAARVWYREERLEQAAHKTVKAIFNDRLKQYDQNPALKQKDFNGMSRDQMEEELLTLLDPVGIHLFYRIHALEQLALDSAVKEMRHPPFGLDKAAVNNAVSTIKLAENTEFPAWLSNWAPWEKALEKMNETKFDNAMDKLQEQFSDPQSLKTKVQEALLAEDGITPDSPFYDDAYRNKSSAITTRIMNDIKIPLTREFLAAQGLSGELESFWK